MNKDNYLSIYGPMKVMVAYILFTMILHAIGPWEYKDETILWAFAFMLSALTVFSIGYVTVASKAVKDIDIDGAEKLRNYLGFLRLARIGLILQFSLVMLFFAFDFLNGKISLESIINPGRTYINALQMAQSDGENSVLVQIKTLAAPLIYLADAFFLYNYSRTGRVWRFLLVITLGVQLLHGVSAKGAQKGFFDLLIMLMSIGVLKVYYDKKQFMKWARYSALFLVGAFSTFSVFQLSRLNAYDALEFVGSDQIFLVRDGLFFSVLGDKLGLSVALFISYLSQGYYGLSLCLQLPFEWTYGIGNSFALTSYAEQYFGIAGVEQATYPFRMQETFGLPAKMYWHTFFPWVASDISFIGSIFLMYFVGRAYAKSFIDGLSFGSPLGSLMFYFLTILLVYLPANNQLMQSREMAIGFIGVLISWLIFGGRYRGRIPRVYLTHMQR